MLHFSSYALQSVSPPVEDHLKVQVCLVESVYLQDYMIGPQGILTRYKCTH